MKFLMKMETQEFNRRLKGFMKKSNLSADVVLRKTAFDLLAKIIRKSPV